MRQMIYVVQYPEQFDPNRILSDMVAEVAILSDEHPTSSYGLPVVLIDGKPQGPADLMQRWPRYALEPRWHLWPGGMPVTRTATVEAHMYGALERAQAAGYTIAAGVLT